MHQIDDNIQDEEKKEKDRFQNHHNRLQQRLPAKQMAQIQTNEKVDKAIHQIDDNIHDDEKKETELFQNHHDRLQQRLRAKQLAKIQSNEKGQSAIKETQNEVHVTDHEMQSHISEQSTKQHLIRRETLRREHSPAELDESQNNIQKVKKLI